MGKWKNIVAGVVVYTLVAAALSAGLYSLSTYSYDLFHFTAEIFSIVIGVCIFIIAWNTRKITSNKFLLFLGISMFFAAFLDLAHTASYKGMGLIPSINESNVATQLWIAARYLQAGSFLFALLFIWGRKTIHTTIIISSYVVITALLLGSIFVWDIFPDCFVVGHGLTTFKIVSEDIIVAMLLASAVILYLRRRQVARTVWLLLLFSLAASIATEAAFTQYVSVFGFANFVGHLFKILAFYLFYRALISSALGKPFDTLFFELSQSERSLRKAKKTLEAAESNLKRERDQAQIYLQSIGKGVVAIDERWNITLWNPEIAAMSGRTSDEVMGKDFRDVLRLLRETDRRDGTGYIEDALRLGKTVDLVDKTILVNKNGSEVPIGGSASPILNKKGETEGAVIIIRDTTTERELAAMRSDFTYASHQLRTPVTKAMWQLEAVLDSDNDKKIKLGAHEAYNSLKSVNKLSSDLADVAEVEQGSIVPRAESVKLASLCADVVKEAHKVAAENSVDIVLDPVPPAASMVTNARMLKRALLELVENGILYSPANSKVVMSVSQSGDEFVFEVKDSGIGIEPDQQPLVFTKFFRGSNFNTSDIAGAGLGLYLAESYVKLLNGKIWLRTTPKKGSTFYISVPAKTAK